MGAIQNGHTNVAKLLLEQEEIDVTAENNKGMTAIIIAQSEKNNEIVEILKNKKGIKIDEKLLEEYMRQRGNFEYGMKTREAMKDHADNKYLRSDLTPFKWFKGVMAFD